MIERLVLQSKHWTPEIWIQSQQFCTFLGCGANHSNLSLSTIYKPGITSLCLFKMSSRQGTGCFSPATSTKGLRSWLGSILSLYHNTNIHNSHHLLPCVWVLSHRKTGLYQMTIYISANPGMLIDLWCSANVWRLWSLTVSEQDHRPKWEIRM